MRVITDKRYVGRTYSAPSAYTERREETGVKFLFKCATEEKFVSDGVSQNTAQ